jgi:hypothetical protein
VGGIFRVDCTLIRRYKKSPYEQLEFSEMLLLVKLTLKDETPAAKIETIEEVDYNFNHKNIVCTEIVEEAD